MKRLFERFYRAVSEGGKPPIPYREIRRVAAIMDRIFECCQDEDDSRMQPAAEPIRMSRPQPSQVLLAARA
jgi:hypothetical protein